MAALHAHVHRALDEVRKGADLITERGVAGASRPTLPPGGRASSGHRPAELIGGAHTLCVAPP